MTPPRHTQRAHTKHSGFTLVELLVSVALFTIVVVTAVSALLVILDANRKAQNISNSTNNAFFAFEHLTRLLRTGYDFHCGDSSTGTLTNPRDCATGDSSIYFTDDRGRFVHVWLQVTSGVGKIMKEVDDTVPMDGGNFGAAYELTADDFDVEALLFHVTGSTIADPEQPKVTITLHGVTSAGTPEQSDFKLQSTVTQRMLDI